MKQEDGTTPFYRTYNKLEDNFATYQGSLLMDHMFATVGRDARVHKVLACTKCTNMVKGLLRASSWRAHFVQCA